VSVLTLIPPQRNCHLVHSKLDCCNSLYYNLPKSQITRLQQIQNFLAHAVVKALKSCHITPILLSLYCIKIMEHIEYKFLSLTYKVLTATHPPYLHNLISVNLLAALNLVILARPPASPSLCITDCSFQYASPCFWNRLPSSLSASLQSLSCCSSSYHIFSLCQLTTLTIHNSLSLPAQNLPLSQIFPTRDSLPASGLTPRTLWLDCLLWASRMFLLFHYSFCSLVPCGN